MICSNLFYAIVVFAIAYTTAFIIFRIKKPDIPYNQYETIDGLRGFLALGVFIHHSQIWYSYIQTGIWKPPQSNLFIQLGSGSVALFFMITSFLFISKLISNTEGKINWTHFFISRLFRIAPMYYFTILIIMSIVILLKHTQDFLPYSEIIQSMFHMRFFSEFKSFNDHFFISNINAGISWSLRYEWLFYFSLPLLAIVLTKNSPPVLFIISGIVFITLFYIYKDIAIHHMYSFAGGGIGALLYHKTALHKKAKGALISSIIILSLILIMQFNSTENILCQLLLATVFIGIALGNNLFGILNNPILKFLGEFSYSTYLLHGILLFACIYMGIKVESIKNIPYMNYSFIVFAITPFLILFSYLGFTYIEKPFIYLGKKISGAGLFK